jgi:flagellar motor switch protein FliN
MQQLQPFVEELTQVLGTLTSSQGSAAAGAFPGERQWYATLSVADAPSDRLAIVIDHDRAAMLARLVSGGAGGVEDASVADLLRNALSQAAAALSVRHDGERLELTLEELAPRSASLARETFTAYAISVPDLPEPFLLAMAWVDAARTDGDAAGNRIQVILDIDLPVVVRFGQTELPIRALSKIGPGSVIDLGRSPDDPVEVLVSNRVVARGEVVIVGGNYGVRILDVASQSERARSMEA